MAVPKDSLTFITGATRHIGSTIPDAILRASYRVRAPIRNTQKGDLLTETLTKRHGPDVFNAMQVCVGVVHVASDMTFSRDPKKVIAPTLLMTTNVLGAAAHTHSVQRSVFTSSAPVSRPRHGNRGQDRGSSWLSTADELIAYSGAMYITSKICTEKACWDFVRDRKSSFVLDSVVLGSSIGSSLDPRLVCSTNKLGLGVLNNQPSCVGLFKMLTPWIFVSLEDNTLRHLAALTDDDVRNERLLALGEATDYNRSVDVLGQLCPGRERPRKMDEPGKAVVEVDTRHEVELLKRFGEDGVSGYDDSAKACLESLQSS
ncbi:NAD(P)-binding protein [Xylariaceae sp. FL0255]|nr:NAD(P)-binding protein [Xylariaceae sp. FL0255]